jgi:hypothetical protein
MLKKYIYLPKDLWLLIFFNSLPIFIIIFGVFSILALCGVEAFLMKDLSRVISFLAWLSSAPMMAGYTACMGWLFLKPGNMLLRLIAIAKGDL